jgi:hypothetical protein
MSSGKELPCCAKRNKRKHRDALDLDSLQLALVTVEEQPAEIVEGSDDINEIDNNSIHTFLEIAVLQRIPPSDLESLQLAL